MMVAYLQNFLGCVNPFGLKRQQSIEKCYFNPPPSPISSTISSFDFVWPLIERESHQIKNQTLSNLFSQEEDQEVMRLLRPRSAATVDNNRTSLDGHGIFAIIVFAIVALICIQPVYIPLPFFISRSGKWIRSKLIGSEDHESEKEGLSAAEAVATETKSNQPTNTKQKRSYLVLNHVWTPAIGILFLLATKTIGGEQIKLGIVGEDGVEPYDVLIFFISLAYIAISLDATGLLRYMAFQVCIKAGSNGMGLYLVLFAFFWTLGVLVGNDPVILSGTAFLVYLTRVAGISPPSAWIWAQFVAANISSAVLVSSNPTNLVIASGFEISFPIYTAYMVLPAFVSAATALGVMLLFFRNETPASVQRKQQKKQNPEKGVVGWTKSIFIRKPEGAGRRRSQQKEGTTQKSTTEIGMQDLSHDEPNGNHINAQEEDESKEFPRAPNIYIPKTIVRPDVDPKAALVDPKGAIFVSTIMAATLIIVIVTNVTGGAKVYMVAAPGAGICLIRDLVYDWYTWRSFRKQEQSEKRDSVETQNKNATTSAAPAVGEQTSANGTTSAVQQENGTASLEKVTTAEQNGNANLLKKSNEKQRPALYRLIALHKRIVEKFPTVSYVASRLPFPLLPFAFGMFILVQSLDHVGFINILAGGLGNVCGHGYIGCSFFISTLGVILCNLGGTNIGATILLTRALQSNYFQNKLPADEAMLIIKTAAYSVAFGSNVGALGGTFAASLAGLLWRDGLRQRGVLVTKSQFALWCAVVIIPALVSGVAILIPEVRYFHVT